MQASRTHFLAINAKGTMQFFLAFQNPKLSSNVHMKSITSNDFRNGSSLHLEMCFLVSYTILMFYILIHTAMQRSYLVNFK